MNPCRHPYIGYKVTLQNKTKDIQGAEVIKVDSLCKVTKIRLEGISSVLVHTITIRQDHPYLPDGVIHKLFGQHTPLQHSSSPPLFMLLASVPSVLWEPLHCT